MSQRKIRQATIKSKTQLTPHWFRFVLEGSDLVDFPLGFEGGYIKLLFKPEDAGAEFDFKNPDSGKPIMRSYTITDANPDRNQIEFELAFHGLSGPAATWAHHSKENDSIFFVGPGPVQMSNHDADFHLMVGDMTALPAIKANLKQLPDDAKGSVFAEITSKEDVVEFTAPKGIDINWIINPHPDTPNSLLPDAVTAFTWPEGRVQVWSACEFNGMRALRKYFKQTRSVPKECIYISSYWKIGDSDEGHKKAKKLDSED